MIPMNFDYGICKNNLLDVDKFYSQQLHVMKQIITQTYFVEKLTLSCYLANVHRATPLGLETGTQKTKLSHIKQSLFYEGKHHL